VWEPQQYLKFADARLQLAMDLLARVELANPTRIYDLGCDTGNSMRLLQRRWPAAKVTGIDNAATMLEQARLYTLEMTWAEQELATWTPAEPASPIFSNAALHWLPHHEDLLPRLLSLRATLFPFKRLFLIAQRLGKR
jgi:trans-aconitate 2-methyltransferase